MILYSAKLVQTHADGLRLHVQCNVGNSASVVTGKERGEEGRMRIREGGRGGVVLDTKGISGEHNLAGVAVLRGIAELRDLGSSYDERQLQSYPTCNSRPHKAILGSTRGTRGRPCKQSRRGNMRGRDGDAWGGERGNQQGVLRRLGVGVGGRAAERYSSLTVPFLKS